MAGFNHPELDRGDGACINLTEDNLCSIYEDRPDFCRLNPKRPAAEQEKWCKLMEANWPTYLQGLTRAPGCGILPGNEKDDG
jgi:Fe-S-cluster containining protein